MKRILWFVACSLLVCNSAAMAQSKVDTKWHCPKQPSAHKLDVGDVPDHSYMIVQGTCDATSSQRGFVEKAGNYTEFQEIWKDSISFHGRFNVTLDNGDKVYYAYEGSASTDTTKPVTQKMRIVNGTGKYKGAKGSEICSTKINADGSSDLECTGTYSMAK